jgi:hypothetical protein
MGGMGFALVPGDFRNHYIAVPHFAVDDFVDFIHAVALPFFELIYTYVLSIILVRLSNSLC